VVVEEMLAVIERHLPEGRGASSDAAAAGTAPQPKAPEAGAPATEPLFSMDGLMRVMGKDPKGRQVLFKMVRNALDGGMAPMDQADLALSEGRPTDAAKVLHSLRGAIGVLGAKRLIRATLEAENAITEQRSAELHAHLNEVRNVLQATLAEADAWLAREEA
jgi:HPt (histidine-containing phosphotransfer) domain-containing protein